jgi:hypothetical protein
VGSGPALHLLSNGEEPVLLKARALWSFVFKCKSKKIIMSSLLGGPALLHSKANGEDPCTWEVQEKIISIIGLRFS